MRVNFKVLVCDSGVCSIPVGIQKINLFLELVAHSVKIVAIENREIIASRGLQAALESFCISLVDFAIHKADIAVPVSVVLRDLFRAVSLAIADDQNFVLEIDALPKDRIKRTCKRLSDIVTWHYYRSFHAISCDCEACELSSSFLFENVY